MRQVTALSLAGLALTVKNRLILNFQSSSSHCSQSAWITYMDCHSQLYLVNSADWLLNPSCLCQNTPSTNGKNCHGFGDIDSTLKLIVYVRKLNAIWNFVFFETKHRFYFLKMTAICESRFYSNVFLKPIPSSKPSAKVSICRRLPKDLYPLLLAMFKTIQLGLILKVSFPKT